MKKSCLYLLIYMCLCSCRDGKMEKEVPIVFFNPNDAGILKTSDYFDGYQVFTFKDVICNEIEDFVGYPHQFLALATIQEGFVRRSRLYSFNLHGDMQCSIGELGRGPGEYFSAGKEILLNQDSSLIIFDFNKYLNYSSQGKLLHEQFYNLDKDIGSNIGRPVCFLGDTMIIFFKEKEEYAVTPKLIEKLRKSINDSYLLNLYSTNQQKVISSYFSSKSVFGYYYNNKCYVFQDTICVYHERDGYIYNVLGDQIVPRYKIDKGKHNMETTIDEYIARQGKTQGISVFEINETDKYVIGIYYFNEHYYYLWYDKKNGVSRNYKLIDDDLLRIGIVKSSFFPGEYFKFWHNKMQFPQDYLYFYYRPTEYAELVKHIQSQLSKKEWEKYKKENPGLIRIYDELNEDSNTIIIGFKYK